MTALKVLIIDDEVILLRSLLAYLEDEGFAVFGATSGEEGLELLRDNQIDAAIVDMRLPDMDGNETITRAHRLQPRLRFIIHTGSTDYCLPEALRKIGISPDAVFLKPVMDLNVFAEAIRHLCRQQP